MFYIITKTLLLDIHSSLELSKYARLLLLDIYGFFQLKTKFKYNERIANRNVISYYKDQYASKPFDFQPIKYDLN